MPQHRETITALNAPAAVGPYVHAVRTEGPLLFCSGQTPLDPESGELVGDTPAAQADRCLRNLAAVCEAAGATLADAVRMTVYVTDMDAFAQVNEAYGKHFEGGELPARVTVGVAALPKGAQVEIDAVVALPG